MPDSSSRCTVTERGHTPFGGRCRPCTVVSVILLIEKFLKVEGTDVHRLNQRGAAVPRKEI
jgi:hypothetical protein